MPDKLDRSRLRFISELQRCQQLGIDALVFHPGSHMKQGEQKGITEVARSIDFCIERTSGKKKLSLCLETTAGQGTSLGYRFEHLRDIIAKSAYQDRLYVCLDTCHIFVAGYDIRTRDLYEATLESFDKIIGLDRLACFHLNDSKHDLGTRRDRHTHIGEGFIGPEVFNFLMTDPRFVLHPGILETPALASKKPSHKMNLNTLNRFI